MCYTRCCVLAMWTVASKLNREKLMKIFQLKRDEENTFCVSIYTVVWLFITQPLYVVLFVVCTRSLSPPNEILQKERKKAATTTTECRRKNIHNIRTHV